ncbi:HTH-type transcriptional activator AllS [bacterium BMS3Abin04]|nr:HTH-type transcriptional activator AllS [bacterium BMS3Abin04]
MINLEWLRTFRTVYKTKSLSKAAELLRISQPTVSQQISTLEAHIGQKLFIRKSKGVIETDEGRILNTRIAGSIEELEGVEKLITQDDSKIRTIITIGISEHLYKTVLCRQIMKISEYVHIKFGQKQQLIKDVENGTLLYAIVPDCINRFDLLCFPLYKQKIVLVGTTDINFKEFENLYAVNTVQAEKWLNKYKWYAHDSAAGFIKLYWLNIFNKKRPNIIPNYIIPNEYEVLFQLSHGKGLTIALDTNVAPFIKDGTLQSCEIEEIILRELVLIANKNKTNKETTKRIISILTKK